MHDNPPPALILAEVRQALESGLSAGFPQKVAANALGIVQRQLEEAPTVGRNESQRLEQLLDAWGDLGQLNHALGDAIRARCPILDAPKLMDHLIRTTVAKIEVDQPGYPPYRSWQRGAGEL